MRSTLVEEVRNVLQAFFPEQKYQMSLSTSSEVLAAHLAGEAVLLNLHDKSYYRLNETAALIWASLEKGDSRDEVLEQLLATYEGERNQMAHELDQVIEDFKSRRLLVENPSR